MNSDLVKAAVSFVIVGIIGIILLAGAGTGAISLPNGLGLFDQGDWTVRIITIIVLLIIAFVLYRVYMQQKPKT